ncbi:hypothetical protein QTJ16_005307 [Diplocarpon rosae]|uniref:UDP-galactose transporter n=1 Tax=Diplocarpon rosae TaxID=946125 RepID=A0AAD9SUQ1_9HELO|nr:hypothetical protein QTJ16_005307 [Diplocarpon rosae]
MKSCLSHFLNLSISVFKMGRLATLWSRSYNPAYLSALCLVVIQVGIGCIMMSSQTGGKYTFSTSSSVTISEFFKFLISSSLIIRACQRDAADPTQNHEAFPISRVSDDERKYTEEEVESERVIYAHETGRNNRTLSAAYIATLDKVSVENRFGFAKLALLYALINNTIFVAYKLADPGTVALIKSGVILITALLMVFALNSDISKVQWIAIIIQLCGLVTTQYRPETGSSYALSTYMVLIFQVTISAVAGVYNQSLLKSDQASIHAQNAILYGCGVCINAMVHLTLSYYTDSEPGFFEGYTSTAAYLVIVSNVFIGLAITAVYKYANAVIKCLATAVATGILLYVSPILFGTNTSPLIVPGGLVVFISSYLYMEFPAAKRPVVTLTEERKGNRPFNFTSADPVLRAPLLAAFTAATIFIICFCETMQIPDRDPPAEIDTLHSPFNSTIAFVRWNSHHEERVPLIKKYEPFFHTLHFSMPSYIDSPLKTEFQNLTHDNWGDGLFPYVQIARTMRYILDQPKNESLPSNQSAADITGLFNFHFDAWVNPMDFAEEDYTKMWMAISRHGDGIGGGPTFVCMTKRERFGGWQGLLGDRNWHYALLHALSDLEAAGTDFRFNPREWCVGWSDVYYIPRHLWTDYIYLATIFGSRGVFHELAIPTIIHIIDQTRRQRELSSIVNWLGDCYGGCCSEGATLDDLLEHRCGHKLNYLGDQNIVATHFQRIDYAASLLGTKNMLQEVQVLPDQPRNWTEYTQTLSQEALTAYHVAFSKVPLNQTMSVNVPPNFVFNQTGLEPPPTPEELKKQEEDRLQKIENDKAAEAARKAAEDAQRIEELMKAESEQKKLEEKLAEMMKAAEVERKKAGDQTPGERNTTNFQENET